MENASKALIIAGAILITLVVISLGIVVFNNFQESAQKNASLTEQEIGDFNSQFEKYSGENVSGSQVNELIQKVISVNLASYNAERADGDRYVEISFPSISGSNKTILGKNTGLVNDTTTSNKVATNKTYKVDLLKTKGIVTKIEITEIVI